MTLPLLHEFFNLGIDTQNPFSSEALRAGAEFAIVPDQHRFGADAFLVIVLAVALVMWCEKL